MNKILYIVLLLFVCITAKRHHKNPSQQCIFQNCGNQLLGCLNDPVCRVELSACNKKYGYAVVPSDFSECSSDDRPLLLWICITSNCSSSQMNNDKN